MSAGKLVRNNIPQLIAQSGQKARTRKVSSTEAVLLIQEKLLEETTELLESVRSIAPNHILDSMHELADVIEVVYSACALQRPLTFEMFADHLVEIAKVKRQAKGSFSEYIFLEEVQ